VNGIGKMYGHGFAMLCLSQAYSMSGKRELSEKLKLAINCTIAAQNENQGWRYRPVKSDADLSITICRVMALRTARDAGINVPDKVRNKTIEYVKKPGWRRKFPLHDERWPHDFPLTAAGLVSLFSAGIYEGKEIERGFEYLKRNRNGMGNHYYFYGH
jgi:mannose/cellobiose epimerase-like protein (N-acyl-D-glucosamine 2-epimerase family)